MTYDYIPYSSLAKPSLASQQNGNAGTASALMISFCVILLIIASLTEFISVKKRSRNQSESKKQSSVELAEKDKG